MANRVVRTGLIQININLKNSTEIELYLHPNAVSAKLENYLALPVLILLDQDPHNPLIQTHIITVTEIALITLSEPRKA